MINFFEYFFFFKKTQARNSQFGDSGVPKRLCIDGNQFLHRVCYLSVRIIFRTATAKWANHWEPLVYSCIVWAALYANLVHGTAGSQRSYVKRKSLTDLPVFWSWEARLAVIVVLSICCAHFSTHINIYLTPAHQILPSCQWFMFNIAHIARPHDRRFFFWL